MLQYIYAYIYRRMNEWMNACIIIGYVNSALTYTNMNMYPKKTEELIKAIIMSYDQHGTSSYIWRTTERGMRWLHVAMSSTVK